MDEHRKTARLVRDEDGGVIDLVIVDLFARPEPPLQVTRQSHELMIAREDRISPSESPKLFVLKAHRERASSERVQRERDVLRQLAGVAAVPHTVAAGFIEADIDAGSIARHEPRFGLLTSFVEGLVPVVELRDPSHLRSWLSCVARALLEIHERRCWHANLTPHNVYATRAGDALLLGFGRAGKIGDENDECDRLGPSARWLPVGEERTQASDQFGFAAMAYELLTGNRLFETGDDACERVHGRLSLDEANFRKLGEERAWSDALARHDWARTDELLRVFATATMWPTEVASAPPAPEVPGRSEPTHVDLQRELEASLPSPFSSSPVPQEPTLPAAAGCTIEVTLTVDGLIPIGATIGIDTYALILSKASSDVFLETSGAFFNEGQEGFRQDWELRDGAESRRRLLVGTVERSLHIARKGETLFITCDGVLDVLSPVRYVVGEDRKLQNHAKP